MFLHDLYNKKNIFETISPIDLAEILFNALQEKYPEVITRYGHEVVGNAVMDRAEAAIDIHSMSDVDIAVQEIIDDLENYQGDRTNDIEPEQSVSEGSEEIPQEIYNLLDELTADDTGSEDFGNYVLRFEGFTDWCQQDAAERCDLPDNDPRKLKYYEDVYDEVLRGWIQEQGAQPVDKGFAGSEDYPVQWAVFKKQDVAEEANPIDTVEMDVPLLIRALEYARENAKNDMDLHKAVERMIAAAKAGEALTMSDYDAIFNNEKIDENLRKWFKEKWVRFGPDGKIRGACARGDSSEGKPKCLPQAKAHALGKKGRATAARRKRKQDPNPERSGKAINVKTKESAELCPECGGPMFTDLILAEKQDACYRKVKSRYKVWPSAYASGALVQCRKKGAANWGNKKKTNEAKETVGQDYQKMMNFVNSQRLSGVPADQQVAVALFKELEKQRAINKHMDAELKAAEELVGSSKKQGEVTAGELTKHRGELEKEKTKQQASKQQLQTLAQQLDQLKSAPDIDPEATAAIERQIAELEQKMQEPSGTGIDASKIAELEQAINDVQQGETVDADAIKRLEQQFKAAEEAAKAAQGRVTQAKDYEAAIAKLNAEIDSLTNTISQDEKNINDLNTAIANVINPKIQELDRENEHVYQELEQHDSLISQVVGQLSQAGGARVPNPNAQNIAAQASRTSRMVRQNTAQAQQTQATTNDISGILETRFYFTAKATLAETLRSEFKMKQDSTGWYLTVDQGRGLMLEAQRAFGIPKIKEVKLKEYNLAAFSGSANIIGDDNPVSPIGSKSLPGRKNA